ncbi:MAG: ATP-binding protein [Alphaproteobacteria bacterium]|nr:ATP-binding protein [Alphaproteobacteria bacterium]
MRDRVSLLVSEIRRDMPDYTVHDVSHLDALWTTADEILGDSYPFNPAEAFVFGGAVLLHDAGMTLAAYPRRHLDLREKPQWRDAVVISWRRVHGKNSVPPAEVTDPAVLRSATVETLRLLHALQASALAVQSWPHPSGAEYLIGDSELRNYYGRTIGKIAQSHWWDAARLAEFRAGLNACTQLPPDWSADTLKVAWLLRCSDAAQLDARRSPRFLHAISPPQDAYSEQHWSFQDGMGLATLRGDALRYTRGAEMPLQMADSWWTCWEQLRLVDRELRAAHHSLIDEGRRPFAARRVLDIETPLALAQHIPTKGWQPVAASVKATDVPRIVDMLGGRYLYGDNPWITVRELIQNACDAVRARKLLDESFRTRRGQGTVHVRLARGSDDTIVLEVSDDGIGMSESVLTSVLLDFGKSLWTSAQVCDEHPGLTGAGFQSAGRFGIGFFSAFSYAKSVRVASRPFVKGADSTRVMDFPGGSVRRPILRDADRHEQLTYASTVVRVELDVAKLLAVRDQSFELRSKLDALLSLGREEIIRELRKVCFMTDCEIMFSDGVGEDCCVNSPSHWMNADGAELVEFCIDLPSYTSEQWTRRVKKYKPKLPSKLGLIAGENGESVGRAVISPTRLTLGDDSGLQTYAGGFWSGAVASDELDGGCDIVGVVASNEPNVARLKCKIDFTDAGFVDWARKQAILWGTTDESPLDQMGVAQQVIQFTDDTGPLIVASFGGRSLTVEQCRDFTRSRKEVIVGNAPLPDIQQESHLDGSDPLEIYDHEFISRHFRPHDEILFLGIFSWQHYQYGHLTSVLDNSFSRLVQTRDSCDQPEWDMKALIERRTWYWTMRRLKKVASFLALEGGWQFETCVSKIGRFNGVEISDRTLRVSRVA